MTETSIADSRFASRKYILAAVALLSVILLFAFQRLTEAAFTSTLTWILGLYLGANVAQKATEKTTPAT